MVRMEARSQSLTTDDPVGAALIAAEAETAVEIARIATTKSGTRCQRDLVIPSPSSGFDRAILLASTASVQQ